MPAAQDAGITREFGDGVFDDLVVIGRGSLLVRDIQLITAGQPDP